MGRSVTVAIPVRNGGRRLEIVLSSVSKQRWDGDLEILVCDSGSTDGSAVVARRIGARVIEIEPTEFSHGGTRNLLMQQAGGDHVAFLTQDALPVADSWLASLASGFGLAPDVGLVFGPYRPLPDASQMVARELTQWFADFAPDGCARVDRLDEDERDIPTRALLGARGFFTDANGCVARMAWEQVPFRHVSYAEDHALAHDMMRAGFAKVFVPEAAVIHSHDYSSWGWLQRSFDEARALRYLYGWREPLHPRTSASKLWGLVGADWRWAMASPAPPASPLEAVGLLSRSTVYHLSRTVGAVLGGHSEHLWPVLAARLSHERRES